MSGLEEASLIAIPVEDKAPGVLLIFFSQGSKVFYCIAKIVVCGDNRAMIVISCQVKVVE